jgi:hypothetical protein
MMIEAACRGRRAALSGAQRQRREIDADRRTPRSATSGHGVALQLGASMARAPSSNRIRCSPRRRGFRVAPGASKLNAEGVRCGDHGECPSPRLQPGQMHAQADAARQCGRRRGFGRDGGSRRQHGRRRGWDGGGARRRRGGARARRRRRGDRGRGGAGGAAGSAGISGASGNRRCGGAAALEPGAGRYGRRGRGAGGGTGTAGRGGTGGAAGAAGNGESPNRGRGNAGVATGGVGGAGGTGNAGRGGTGGAAGAGGNAGTGGGAGAGPTCTDLIKNGGETDVDCGGPCASKCAVNLGCSVNGDCKTGSCSHFYCALVSGPPNWLAGPSLNFGRGNVAVAYQPIGNRQMLCSRSEAGPMRPCERHRGTYEYPTRRRARWRPMAPQPSGERSQLLRSGRHLVRQCDDWRS